MSQEMKLNLDEKFKTFSARLKAAREAMHLETKEAASQLRLNERIILMLESGTIDPTLPTTFLKGYIRNYAKLVQIPEQEVKNLLEPLQAAAAANAIDPTLLPPAENTITSSNYRMQFATAFIALSIVGLVGTWWHAHTIHTGSQTDSAPQIAIPTADSSPIQSKPAPISMPTPAQTSAGAEHPLVGALVQQISPPAPNSPAAAITNAPQVSAPTAENNQPAAVVAPTDKPAPAAKPAPAPKATTKPQENDDADDNDDDDNSSD